MAAPLRERDWPQESLYTARRTRPNTCAQAM